MQRKRTPLPVNDVVYQQMTCTRAPENTAILALHLFMSFIRTYSGQSQNAFPSIVLVGNLIRGFSDAELFICVKNKTGNMCETQLMSGKHKGNGRGR